jgi:putative endonuclease
VVEAAVGAGPGVSGPGRSGKDGKDSRDGKDGRDELGRWGEKIAAEHLQRQGLVLLSRNWRCREGEIDLVLTDGERLIVCEVKTRSGGGFGAPAEAVTRHKARKIRRVTQYWLAAHQVRWCEVRFDVVAVECPPGGEPTIEHFVEAF